MKAFWLAQLLIHLHSSNTTKRPLDKWGGKVDSGTNILFHRGKAATAQHMHCSFGLFVGECALLKKASLSLFIHTSCLMYCRGYVPLASLTVIMETAVVFSCRAVSLH